MATIGTHSGAFQADEALGVYMLKTLPQYRDAQVIRSRDLEVLKPLTIVIDVGGSYSHDQLRYDHHQRGFFETFDGENVAAKDGGRPDVTGPETATGVYKTKLSASGLVYKHYGREIIGGLHPHLRANADALEWVYNKMYKDFMEGLDADDNGIEIADVVRYKQGTSLPVRVARLNGRWNDPPGGPSEDERFHKASALCGSEFASMLEYIVECELPARTLVEEALVARTTIHASGEVICFANGGCVRPCPQPARSTRARAGHHRCVRCAIPPTELPSPPSATCAQLPVEDSPLRARESTFARGTRQVCPVSRQLGHVASTGSHSRGHRVHESAGAPRAMARSARRRPRRGAPAHRRRPLRLGFAQASPRLRSGFASA